MTPIARASKEVLKRFPEAHTLTLARILLRDHPLLFATIEDARSALRYYRGNMGVKNLDMLADKTFLREPRKPGDAFAGFDELLDLVPKGETHFTDWKALQIDGPMNALVLSDLHIPFHNKDSVMAALKYGRDAKVDTIILNGDTADCHSVSFWEKDPEKRDFQDELDTLVDFLSTLRSLFPRARIIMKAGNHEERYARYMRAKAPELFAVRKFKPKSLFELDDLGIQWVPDMRPIRLGLLSVIHGHEFKFQIANPVNPARGFFLKAKCHVLGSHFHQVTSHSERTLEGQDISTWSIGCLCDLHPDYSPVNNWRHGFARVEVSKDGTFNVKNKKIIDGRIFGG